MIDAAYMTLAQEHCATPPPSPIDATLDELAETFEFLGDWEERYRHVIDLGRDLAPLAEDERSDANKVRGCASPGVAWSAKPMVAGALGFVAIPYAHRAGSHRHIDEPDQRSRPAEILGFDAKDGFERLGLTGALSQQRSNGLFSMVERIRHDAAGATGATGSFPTGEQRGIVEADDFGPEPPAPDIGSHW